MLPIPQNAPFSPEQIGWLNGYLAARMQVQAGASGAAVPPAPVAEAITTSAGLSLTILWGSQTGNSETLAKKAAKSLTTQGHQVTTIDMAEAEVEFLTKNENLLLITSTYGDGEPPDNAAALHELLHSEDAPSLDNISYSVLGLGDSEYPDFNQCAKEFDTVLEKLGAQRLTPLVESDVDYDEPFDQWISQLTDSLKALA